MKRDTFSFLINRKIIIEEKVSLFYHDYSIRYFCYEAATAAFVQKVAKC